MFLPNFLRNLPRATWNWDTEKTAEAADADSILKPRDKWSEDTAEMESPNREIQEMLKNHEEPLEEWKD